MKIRHYAIFNQELKNIIKDDGWELLRNDPSEQDYYIPDTFEKYIKKVDIVNKKELATDIINCARKNSLDSIISIGVGIASLEYALKKNSDLSIEISDYNDAIFKLKTFNIFDNVYKLNVLKDKLPFSSNKLLIFPRIDTEFTDTQIATLVKKCHESDVKVIYFIPAQLLTMKVFLVEVKIWLTAILLGKKRTFCGYSRTKQHFVRLVDKYYTCQEQVVDNKLNFIFMKK